MTTSNVDVIRLWQLPDDFFALDLDAQWRAIKAVTSPAQRLNAPRRPCPLSLRDEVLALAFFCGHAHAAVRAGGHHNVVRRLRHRVAAP